jgi:hypothetical protein
MPMIRGISIPGLGTESRKSVFPLSGMSSFHVNFGRNQQWQHIR